MVHKVLDHHVWLVCRCGEGVGSPPLLESGLDQLDLLPAGVVLDHPSLSTSSSDDVHMIPWLLRQM